MPDDIESPEPEPFALPDDFAEQVQSWDVPIEALPEAVDLYKRSQTEEGVIEGFIQYGQALGFGLKEMEKLFVEDDPAAVTPPAAPAAPAASPEPVDLDRQLTVREAQEIIAAERAAIEERFAGLTEAEEARQQAAFETRRQETFTAIDQWFTEKGIESMEARQVIARLGEATIAEGVDSYNPQVAVAALERGFAAYDGFVEKEAQAVLARKAARGEALPVDIGGSGGSEGGEGEAPVNYGELRQGALSAAKQRVRDRLRQSGELG